MLMADDQVDGNADAAAVNCADAEGVRIEWMPSL